VLSAALMLNHLGLDGPAGRIESAVHDQLRQWAQTQTGRGLSTAQRGDAFVSRLTPDTVS